MMHINKHRTLKILFLTVGLGIAGCAGTPAIKGAAKGYVAGCPNTDSCVSSQTTREGQKIAPLAFTGSKANAMAKLKDILAKREDARIVQDKADYLHVEFTMKVTGFIDDAEFLLRASDVQMRSISRNGYSDFGMNRKRLEEIRAAFTPCCQ